MAIRPETQQPPAAERTRFERIQLPEGQLSVVRPLPTDFPPGFVEQLINEEPWNKTGKLLHPYSRKPELFQITEVSVVKKKSRLTGKDVKREIDKMGGPHTPKAKIAVRDYTPSTQMALVDKAKNRYREAYGRELIVEEPIAFYIDRESTEKYTFYKYHREIKQDDSTTEEWKRIKTRAAEKERKLNEELEKIGIDRFETSRNYLIVEDPSDKDGIEIVLIDTEFWTIKDQRPII